MYSDGAAKVLAVFYSSGDFDDVGRHAVAAALERSVSKIKVIASDASIDSLERSNWKCGCARGDTITPQDRTRLELIRADFSEDMSQYIEGVDAVISCLGNRQPFHQDRVAKVGTANICKAMLCQHIGRIVIISSVGIGGDWPPLEWSREGNLMQAFFRTICWQKVRLVLSRQDMHRNSLTIVCTSVSRFERRPKNQSKGFETFS
jgi:hypothetical protein